MKSLKVIFPLLLFFPVALIAQNNTFFNWKGNALEVFEKPGVKSKVLGKIAKGAKVKVIKALLLVFSPYILAITGIW